MNIQLKGQLQSAAGQSMIEISPEQGESLGALIQRAAISLPDAARHLILTDDGGVRSSLFVALDGVHTRDLDQSATADELLLMPPMAGG